MSSTDNDEERLHEGEQSEEWVAEDDAVIGRAFRRSMIVLAVAAAAVLIGWLVLQLGTVEPEETALEADAPQRLEEAPEAPTVRFADVTAAAGIDWTHENGAAGDALLPETMGGGAAFLDYDQDGDADLLLVNSTTWDGRGDATMGFFENDGTGRFTERTAEVGLALSFYGTGVAVGDYDNDGFPDVFVSAVGSNYLFRNAPAGEGRRFDDVTASTGVAGDASEWSTTSAFLDVDGDADLDLLVGNYVRWSRDIDIEVNYTLDGIERAYGPPANYEGTFSYLYRNDGGRFTDVSEAAGLHITNPATGRPVGKTLGIAPLDVDADGDLDVFLANDTVRNFFLENQGDGTFVESAELTGLAYGREGSATGAMGVDAGHHRNDGSIGFFIGNFANEMTSVYVSQSDPLLYSDEAIAEGVGAPSRRMLTFGVFLFDYDLDGRLDLLQCNGHLEDDINKIEPSQNYRQPPQLFWNAGLASRQTFVPIELATAGDLGTEIVGRGASFADIDLDGDLDVLLLQTGDRPLLLRNDQALGRHWLRVEVRGDGVRSNRDAIGAWVELEAGGVQQRRQVMPTRSYQSQVELPVHFGLGDATSVDRLVVRWPDGTTQDVDVPGVDQTLRVQRTN